MNQIGFKGYAQSLGFDPIQAPDESKKILESGQQEINNLKQSAEWNRQNRQAYADSLSRKNQLEAQNKDRNYQFEKDWRKAYQQAVLGNQETALRSKELEIKNAQRNSDQVANNFKALGEFSQTAVKLASEYQEKRDAADEIEGMNFVMENGISAEQFQRFRAGEEQLNAGDMAINALANQTTNPELRSHIRGLSGKKLYGAMKQLAIQGGIEYEPFLIENSRKPVLVNGEYTTLDDAKDQGPEVYAAARVALRSEYLKRFAGMSPELANEYLYEGMRKVEAAHNSAYSEARNKALEAQEDEESTRTLTLGLKGPQGGQAVVEWYMSNSGGDKAMIGLKRREALGLLQRAAAAGQFTSEDLTKLEETGISLGGADPKPFAELYGAELVGLRDEVRKFNNQKRQEAEQAQSDEKDAFKRKFLETEQSLGRNYNNAEIRELRKQYESTFGDTAPDWLRGRESQEELTTELGNDHLQFLANRGLLTKKELMSGKYSEDSITKFADAAKAGDSFNTVSTKTRQNLENAVAQELKRSLNSVGAGSNQNPSYYLALERAQGDVTARAQAYITDGIDPTQALNTATKDVIADIQLGTKGQGVYAINGRFVDGKFTPDYNEKTRGFSMSIGNGTAAAQSKRTADVVKQVVSNASSLASTRYLNEAEIKQLENFGKNGGGSLPPLLSAISSKLKNASIFDVADAQLQAWGKPPLQRPAAASLYDEVSPEVRQLLTWRPSTSRTLQAVERSGGNAYTSLLNLIASKESVTTDRANNGYDAFNRGGSNNGHTAHGSGNTYNGRKLSQMTVGEIMSLQADQKLHATGRYQIIGSTLRGLVNSGVASRDEYYTPEVQDKLAIALVKGRAGRFFSGKDSLDKAIYGMGSEWIGLQYVDQNKLGQVLQQTKANLQNVGFNTSDWKSGVVYRVNSIGPTSTGPHIDAKLDGGGYFNRNYLDKFVEVNDRGKWVPISAGETAPGGRFGAPRSYGSHNGWDYAFDKGSPVRLKGGARVVRKQQTEHGLKLSIALPDGRVVNFLHGTA
jgi:muramidase (phage lysozyme)